MTEQQPNSTPPGVGWQPVYIKKTRGAGFWVAVGLASFFFLCSILLFSLFVGSLLIGKAFVTSTVAKEKIPIPETVLEGSGENKVVIIPIKGILSSESAEGLLFDKPGIVELVKKQLDQAAGDALIKAVVLEVDSPGGGITASDVVYNQIMKFKAGTQKKVVVYMQDIAASGGYYISAAADAIVAHPTTITGSIGVIMPLINVAELVNKYGIKDTSITSGNMKELGSPFKQMTAEETAILKDIVDEMYLQFVTVVSIGRRLEVEAVKKLADGRIFTGKQALEKGLVDQLGYLEDAIDLVKKLAGLTEATIVRYEEQHGLADLFGLMSNRLFQSNTIKLDLARFHEQDDFKPMYLWTGQAGNR